MAGTSNCNAFGGLAPGRNPPANSLPRHNWCGTLRLPEERPKQRTAGSHPLWSWPDSLEKNQKPCVNSRLKNWITYAPLRGNEIRKIWVQLRLRTKRTDHHKICRYAIADIHWTTQSSSSPRSGRSLTRRAYRGAGQTLGWTVNGLVGEPAIGITLVTGEFRIGSAEPIWSNTIKPLWSGVVEWGARPFTIWHAGASTRYRPFLESPMRQGQFAWAVARDSDGLLRTSRLRSRCCNGRTPVVG